MRDSDLLLPSRTGGFRTSSCLAKPFKTVCAALNLEKKVTPKGMRRTFQDLARAAEIKDIVTRAVSGHATEAMQERYSTAAQTEIEECVAKVISLAGYKKLVKDAA